MNARFLPILILLAWSVLGWGCERREYRVKMRDQGGIPQRVFTDSAPSMSELDALQKSYGHEARSDPETGDRYFEATFDDNLPLELAGANGWSRLAGGLGDALFWFERPLVGKYSWPTLVQRVESGILWLRITKLWAIQEFGEERAEAIDRFFEETVIPGVVDGYLRFVGAGSVMTAQRVGFGLRKPDSTHELTPDEFFRLQVLIPIIIDVSRDSNMTPDELHMGMLMGMDGGSTKAERRKAWRAAGEAVALRFVQELDPGRESVSWNQIRGWGFSLLLFAAQPGKYKQLMLDSPAVSDSEKRTIVDGGAVYPPMPFGVRILGGSKGDLMTYELEPETRPFMGNGISRELDGEAVPSGEEGGEADQVLYRMRLKPADEGPLFGPPPAYAFWSVPDQSRQRAIFGAVPLAGLDLALVTGWEHLLEDAARSRWDAALEQAALEGGPDRLRDVLGTIDLAAPECLAELLSSGD